MTDSEDDSLNLELVRAQHADELLNNPLLVDILDTMEKDLIEGWRATPARDTDARERLWQAVQVTGIFRSKLIGIIGDGKLAGAYVKAVQTDPDFKITDFKL